MLSRGGIYATHWRCLSYISPSARNILNSTQSSLRRRDLVGILRLVGQGLHLCVLFSLDLAFLRFSLFSADICSGDISSMLKWEHQWQCRMSIMNEKYMACLNVFRCSLQQLKRWTFLQNNIEASVLMSVFKPLNLWPKRTKPKPHFPRRYLVKISQFYSANTRLNGVVTLSAEKITPRIGDTRFTKYSCTSVPALAYLRDKRTLLQLQSPQWSRQ